MLNVKSCFSISKSTIKISELVKACCENNIPYAAICDENFYALPKLIKLCSENGLKAVFGLIDKSGFCFFVLNRSGYDMLVQFKNNLIELDSLLVSEDILTVYTGEIQKYLEMSVVYKKMFYGADLSEDVNQIQERTVFFKTINVLNHKDKESLEFIQDIGRISNEERQKAFSLEEYLKLEKKNESEFLFENIKKITEQVDSFDLNVDYHIPVLDYGEYDENKILEQKTKMRFEELITQDDERYGEYKKRYDYEYSIISKKRFSRYLLLAADIVETAHDIGAVIGPGRGSAVGSLLVYLLGITQPDPVETSLIFERFLSEDRMDEPDIDIDVEDQMRPELLETLRKKYGSFFMVHVITFGTYGEKLIKRELDRQRNIKSDAIKSGDYDNIISTIKGLPHHVSTHAAGLIFSEDDLRYKIPLQSMGEDFFMTQYDMDALKSCGIFKMDILGLITLSTLKSMSQLSDDTNNFMFEKVNLNDEEVYKQIKSDNLKGIFQLDSKSGRALAEKFTPKNFDEIRVIISLNRPGPNKSGLTDEWIQRRNGEKKTEYYHPLVKEILSDTWGVPIYQEQIMEMSMKLAGFSPKQANDLRKAMAKKDPDKMKKLEMQFVNGCVQNDMEIEGANELFNMMYEFAGYAFNKAHATAYSFITYWTFYAKYHYPLSFYKTMIDSSHGKYQKLFEIINEARKNDILIFPPDINKSHYDAVFENGGLRIGFNLIKEFSKSVAEKIIAEREHGFFKSVEDFAYRIDNKTVSDKLLQKCIWAHIFFELNENVTLSSMVTIRDKNKKALKKIGARLFGEMTELEKKVSGKTSNSEITIEDNVKEEIAGFGFIVSYERIFKLGFSPFMNSRLEIAIVVSEIKPRLYEVTDGYEYRRMTSPIRIKTGDFILLLNKGKQNSLMGFYYPETNSIEIQQNIYNVLERDIMKDMHLLKKSGIKRINIKTKTKTLEVSL
jgi:DNA polymerase-3 subunit alpha